MLQTQTDSVLILIDLGQGRARLGGSILAQTQGVFGEDTPDLEDPQQLERLRQVFCRLANNRWCMPITIDRMVA